MLKRTFLTIAIGAAMVMTASASDDDIASGADKLAHSYDDNYNHHDAAGMGAIYAPDGFLVSPGGAIIRGRAALESYYQGRFATGARDHESKIAEAHAMGDGGYGLGTFSVNAPQADGSVKRLAGNIVYVYTHSTDGWRLQAVVPSVPPAK
jgi:ketosteroid isomerase-like protein